MANSLKIFTSILPEWAIRRYKPLPQEKDGESSNDDADVKSSTNTSSPQPSRKRIVSGILLATLFIGSIPLLLVNRGQHPHQWPTCGDSPQSARERGCFFDLITFAWQMPDCYDAPLVDEFADWASWTFWADENGNETVSVMEARRGDRELYLPWRFHVVHCTFVWRQMHRAYEAGYIDEHSRSYHHTTHCQKMLLMDCRDEGRFCILPNDTVVTAADLIYPACEKIDKGIQSKWDGFLTQSGDSYS